MRVCMLFTEKCVFGVFEVGWQFSLFERELDCLGLGLKIVQVGGIVFF